jgi:hypothetical protein
MILKIYLTLIFFPLSIFAAPPPFSKVVQVIMLWSAPGHPPSLPIREAEQTIKNMVIHSHHIPEFSAFSYGE